MKKISTTIALAIILCMIFGVTLAKEMSVFMAKEELKTEAQEKVKAISGEYAGQMVKDFVKYETIVKTVGDYVSTSFDADRLGDAEYNAEYIAVMEGFLGQAIAGDEGMRGIYLYMNPEQVGNMYAVWYDGGGMFEIDQAEEYGLFMDNDSSFDFYFDAVERGEAGWTETYIDEDTGAEVISYTAPIYSGDTLLGVVGMDRDFEYFKSIIHEISIYDTGRAFLMDSANNLVIDEINPVGESADSVGYTNLAGAITENDEGTVTEKVNGQNQYLGYNKLNDFFTLVTIVSEQEVLADINRISFNLTVMSLFVGALCVGLSLLIGANISRPIVMVVKDMKLMQTGNFTGTNHVKYLHKRNEVGDLSKAAKAIQEAMQSMIGAINHDGDNIKETSDNLYQITDDLVRQIVSISAASEELAASMEATAETADTLSKATDQMVVYIDGMDNRNKEGLSESIEISKRAIGVKEEAQKATVEADRLADTISEKMETAIVGAKQVEKIEELTDKILSIADQTNLLSLNASIEAARAGMAGRGFAVVADEISKLAVDVQKSAQEIQQITSLVTGTVEELAKTAEEMLKFMQTHMKDTYEKLIATSGHYSDDASYFNNLLKELSDGVDGISQQIKMVASTFETFRISTAEGVIGTNGVAASSEVIAEKTNDLQSEGKNMGIVSDHLMETMSKIIV
ncbi:MAG: methyl-accepting chemotaxis protein [Lachnospiraceae bacterium]|jgi:methyl-accepting chemotaxis protein|nr:methyl-accepting chemotaxis protein [Lachnospiraceae bacterium]